MTDQATPAKVRLTDVLGPTLKPDGWSLGESYYPAETTHLGEVRFRGIGAERYTADQVRALLAEHTAAAVAAERKPLTLDQCRALVAQHFEHGELIGDDLTLIRAVERAHGIGAQRGANMTTIWLLTAQYNDYDQHGDYFIEAFLCKPTIQELMQAVPDINQKEALQILKGDGTWKSEYTWYTLEEYTPIDNLHAISKL